MTLPDFLTEWPGGDIMLNGHRIGLDLIVHFYNEGYSPEMLVGRFPTLPLALIYKVIAFYLENAAEVDAYVARKQSAAAEQRAAGRHPDWQMLRKRLEAMREAETTPRSEGA